ncbi:MAG: ketoacyl-ACP synthase III [Deltaproteobacteria bacterium]|nr:ketoacyl-ACP synthase III [Deltaproteobacteria bacterium]
MEQKVRAAVAGTGAYLPQARLTNAALAARLDATDEWIVERTGIRERRVAAREESTGDMAAAAARAALQDAGITADEVDLIMVATCTPDMVMPSTACLVQHALGARKAAAFDVNAACSGFVYALHVARGLVEAGMHRTVLCIGADKMSGLMDARDKGTSILFGDGAGAVVVRRDESGTRGVVASHIHSDGDTWDLITVPGGGSRAPLTAANVEEGLQFMQMKGREVFRIAVRCLEGAVRESLEQAGLDEKAVALCIPHQSNARIVEAVADRLQWPREKVFTNLEWVGNTSAASIPVALHQARTERRVKAGDVVILAGMGAGMTWGGAVVRL